MSLGEGARTCLIHDGYLATPPADGKPNQSHEAVCILTTGISDAHIRFDLFFEDRDSIKDIPVIVEAERTDGSQRGIRTGGNCVPAGWRPNP
jgi:hypothetical protein